MDYRYTDENSTQVTISMTLAEVEFLRDTLAKALEANIEGLRRWTVRDMDAALAKAQASAADTLAYQVDALRRLAKRGEE